MKTILYILIFIFFACGPFYFIVASGAEKLEKRGYGCGIALLVIFFWIVFTMLGVFNVFKSCGSSSPSIDYYESPR